MPPQEPPPIDPEMCAQIVGALSRAYESACEHYDESQGCKESTFGFELYHKCGFQLSRLDGPTGGRIREVSEFPAYRHAVDEYTVVCHRVARTADADIHQCFPESEGASAIATPFLPGFEPDVSRIRTLVIAHMGNHEEGLLAVYLCAPVTNGDGRMQWGFAIPIYTRSMGIRGGVANPAAPPPPAASLPPEEVIDQPQLTRRRRRDDESSNDGR